MFFDLFESKSERELRFLKSDLENEVHRLDCERRGIPFFGTRYQDDTRKPEEKLRLSGRK